MYSYKEEQRHKHILLATQTDASTRTHTENGINISIGRGVLICVFRYGSNGLMHVSFWYALEKK